MDKKCLRNICHRPPMGAWVHRLELSHVVYACIDHYGHYFLRNLYNRKNGYDWGSTQEEIDFLLAQNRYNWLVGKMKETQEQLVQLDISLIEAEEELVKTKKALGKLCPTM